MRKILELSEKHFLTGIAPSSQVQDKGLFSEAVGITPVRDPFLESDNLGLLQAAPSPTDLTGSTVVDVPWAWTTDVSGDRYFYAWGNAGHLYRIDLSGDNSPSDIASGAAVSNPAASVFWYKHSNGDDYVYYFQLTQIGRWDISGAWAGRTDNYKTGLQSTAYHGAHRFLDRVYFCNGRYVGQLVDDGAGGFTMTATALDAEGDDRVNCLSDDGVYLVAGITKNQSSDTLVHGNTRIIFWDTNSSSWQREWSIPDASIQAIRRVGSVMQAITSRGLFAFTFSSPPVPVLPLLTTAVVPSASLPGHYAADVIREAILIGGDARISTFGKLAPQMPNAFLQPYGGFTGTLCMVASSAKTSDIFVGTSSSKLYRLKLTGAPQTGVNAKTIFIDLGRWWQIGRIVIEFASQLASGDNLNIDVQPDDTTSATDWGTASYASHGAIRSKELYGSQEARKLRLIFNFNGGTPRIRRVEVWGDSIERPAHTRV